VSETPAPIPLSYADTENILRQVTDHIKVDIGVDSSSMELQLHPASLGTVNLQIASSNGVITANLLVQNETVKAALESQMVKLLETFEEQGQKVEAIEVSVAGYDLDRSLSGDSGSDAGDRQDKDSGRIGRTARRRLNLNELDEEGFEDLTEEEQLAAKIMDANGTSVDYKA
ncbi:MAG: flagellar hook-length control protein FliK, partial [Lachnospiraceae bacterium]|nr:flagellar hook-length control protein FliK [Lachnospiraceae bacterium]